MQKQQLIALGVSLVLVAGLLAVAVYGEKQYNLSANLTKLPLSSGEEEINQELEAQLNETLQAMNNESTTSSAELIKEDIKVGNGSEAKTGDTVAVHYVGTLPNGQKFDSSRDRGTPFEFTVGAGDVIKGWDQGIPGMKVGGIRKLTIPAALAYGEYSPSPLIPANSTLVFEVELMDIKK